MSQNNQGYMCCCTCHGTIKFHGTIICECGKPIVPPQPCNQTPKQPPCPPPKHPPCPPPEPKCGPGTVDIPQPPPFKASTSPTPPWHQDKPKQDDPNELPWFRGKIGQIRSKGPTFGPRKDEFLPYLLIRTASDDRGARPFSGIFWESPDIFVSPNQEATIASLMPPPSAGVAQANVPNTLYAHVWNLGKAPAYRVRVEFYWFNPTLGISRADANLIGAAWIDLANRFTLLPQWVEVSGPSGKYMTRGSHAIVRCPETWIPTYENQGHECLVVRVFEPILDPVSYNQFLAASDRHVAQRNIAVVQASSPAVIDMTLNLGYVEAPAEAEVEVEMDNPNSMEWLKLFTGKRDHGLQLPSAQVISGFLPPAPVGSRMLQIKKTTALDCCKHILRPRERFHRGCDPLQIPFHASVEDLKAQQAQVLRIRQRINGSVIGGYSVVLLNKAEHDVQASITAVSKQTNAKLSGVSNTFKKAEMEEKRSDEIEYEEEQQQEKEKKYEASLLKKKRWEEKGKIEDEEEKKYILMLNKEARSFFKMGNFTYAEEKWKEVLKLDRGNREALAGIEKIRIM